MGLDTPTGSTGGATGLDTSIRALTDELIHDIDQRRYTEYRVNEGRFREDPLVIEDNWAEAITQELDRRHYNNSITLPSIAVPAPGVCISLHQVLHDTECILGEFSAAAAMGIDARLIAEAALNHLFYGTVLRGNKYHQVMHHLDLVGIPPLQAQAIYNHVYQGIRQELQCHFGDEPCYIEYAYLFLDRTDFIVIPVPLHDTYHRNRAG